MTGGGGGGGGTVGVSYVYPNRDVLKDCHAGGGGARAPGAPLVPPPMNATQKCTRSPSHTMHLSFFLSLSLSLPLSPFPLFLFLSFFLGGKLGVLGGKLPPHPPHWMKPCMYMHVYMCCICNNHA